VSRNITSLALILLLALIPSLSFAQQPGKGKLTAIEFVGLKTLAEEPVKAILGLHLGDLVGKDDLQAAADRLVATGLFATVTYEFRSRGENLTVTYRLEEAPRVPVLFDNIPWFTDAELSDAIRKSVPVFDGTAPQESPLLDDMAAALGPLLAARGLKVTVEHQLLANPSGDGSLQVFRVEGAALKIGRVEFGDPLAAQSPYLQQKLEAVVGKPYSRLAIDLFLFEHVRPFYQEQGCLRASIGMPEIRLTGNFNQVFVGDMGVFIFIQPGSVYHWGGAQWIGNQALAVSELNALIGAQASDVVNGQRIQAGWDKVLDEYAYRGYLDAKVDPQSAYDDAKHTVAYQVHVSEGPQYRYGDMLVTGLSVLGEKKIRSAWNVPAGAIFDRAKFEELLAGLEKKSTAIFGDLPVHYEQVGHWLRTNPDTRTVDILLDFK